MALGKVNTMVIGAVHVKVRELFKIQRILKMKTKLHVSYCIDEYITGFKFTDYVISNEKYIYMGEIEIDNPFEVLNNSVLNNAHIEIINAKIKDHKAQINLLENKVKDLLCIESKEA